MKFDERLVKQIQVIQKAHFIGQSALVDRSWDTYCLIIQTNKQILLNMKDGFNEALIKEGFMHNLHMQVGFNNTVYCVQCSESQSGAEVVEFFV